MGAFVLNLHIWNQHTFPLSSFTISETELEEEINEAYKKGLKIYVKV